MVAYDLESTTEAMISAYKNEDLQSLRAEKHKLRPIIKNLNMNSVSAQIGQLSSVNELQPSVLDIILAIKSKIDTVVRDLRDKIDLER